MDSGKKTGGQNADGIQTLHEKIEQLKAANARLEKLFDSTRDVFWIRDLELNITYISNSVYKLRGYSPKEAAALPLEKTMPPESLNTVMSILQEEIELENSGKGDPDRSRILDLELYNKDGSKVLTEITLNFLRDEKGRATHITGVSRDISKRLEALHALEISEAFANTLLASSPNPILVINPDSSIRFVNRAFEDLTGYTVEDLKNVTAPYPWWTEEFMSLSKKVFGHSFVNGVKGTEALFKRKDGSHFWVKISSTPVKEKGELIYYLSNWTDISDLKNTRYKSKLQTDFLGQMQDRVLAVDLEGKIVYANKAGAELLGCDEEQAVGKSIYDISDDPEIHDFQKTVLDQTREKGSFRGEVDFIKGMPGMIMELATWLVEDEFGKPKWICSIGTDITERKAAEQDRSLLATAIDQTADSVIVTDIKGVIKYINPAFVKLTGYSSEEAVGSHITIIESGKHPKEFYDRLWEAIWAGKIWKGRITNIKKDGTLYECEQTINPVTNQSGEIISYVALQRDVTRELKIQQNLRHAQKMEAVGTLAGGVAHEINNNLQTIFGHIHLCLDQVPEHTQVGKSLRHILKVGKSSKSLIEQLLTFSRRSEKKRRVIDFAMIIKETVNMLKSTIPANIKVDQKVKCETCKVMGDANQIQQVLVNLVNNAGYAIGEKKGRVRISISHLDIPGGGDDTHPMLEKGAYVLLEVEDNGDGMDEKVMARIFEPFFTTKKTGKGTGLGLAVVHGIVTDHGGFLDVKSETGAGSHFKVYLPRVD